MGTTRLLLLAAFTLGCSSSSNEVPVTSSDAAVAPEDVETPADLAPDPGATDPGPEDSGPVDAVPLDVFLKCGPGTPEGKAAACAGFDALGKSLTSGYGRADGTVSAVVGPLETHCEASCNPTHLTVQVDLDGKPHRFVVTAVDKYSDSHEMFYATKKGPLVGPAWSVGWHQGADVALDYVQTPGVHAADFQSYHRDELTALVTDALAIGAKVSIYATAEDDPARAHLIHRYAKKGQGKDGAIVVDPDGEPTYLMFFYEDEGGF